MKFLLIFNNNVATGRWRHWLYASFVKVTALSLAGCSAQWDVKDGCPSRIFKNIEAVTSSENQMFIDQISRTSDENIWLLNHGVHGYVTAGGGISNESSPMGSNVEVILTGRIFSLTPGLLQRAVGQHSVINALEIKIGSKNQPGGYLILESSIKEALVAELETCGL